MPATNSLSEEGSESLAGIGAMNVLYHFQEENHKRRATERKRERDGERDLEGKKRKNDKI